jgi:hypothetical protein
MRLDFEVATSPLNETRLDPVDRAEGREVVVATVENVVRSQLVRYRGHYFGVVRRDAVRQFKVLAEERLLASTEVVYLLPVLGPADNGGGGDENILLR